MGMPADAEASDIFATHFGELRTLSDPTQLETIHDAYTADLRRIIREEIRAELMEMRLRLSRPNGPL